MRVLVFILILLSSSTAYAEWNLVSKSVDGTKFYVDFERIRKVDGYVYYWHLSDYIKASKYGDFSVKVYHQGDCKLFRFKDLSWTFHKEPMGGGTGDIDNEPDKEWSYPSPKSVNEAILESVCDWVK